MQPHVGGGAGDTIGGVHGFAGEAEIDFRINHLAAMRYLWFIERRSAMQALLDLVQANLTAGEVCEVRDFRHTCWLHLAARQLHRAGDCLTHTRFTHAVGGDHVSFGTC